MTDSSPHEPHDQHLTQTLESLEQLVDHEVVKVAVSAILGRSRVHPSEYMMLLFSVACLSYAEVLSGEEDAIRSRKKGDEACQCNSRIHELLRSSAVDLEETAAAVLKCIDMLMCLLHRLDEQSAVDAFSKFIGTLEKLTVLHYLDYTYVSTLDYNKRRLRRSASLKKILSAHERAFFRAVIGTIEAEANPDDLLQDLYFLREGVSQKSEHAEEILAAMVPAAPVDFSPRVSIEDLDAPDMSILTFMPWLLRFNLPRARLRSATSEIRRRTTAWRDWKRKTSTGEATLRPWVLEKAIHAAVADVPADHPEVLFAKAVATNIGTAFQAHTAFLLTKFYTPDALEGAMTVPELILVEQSEGARELRGDAAQWVDRLLQTITKALGGRAPLTVMPAEEILMVSPAASLELIATGLVKLVTQARQVPLGIMVIEYLAPVIASGGMNLPIPPDEPYEEVIDRIAFKYKSAVKAGLLPLSDAEFSLIQVALDVCQGTYVETSQGETSRIVDALLNPINVPTPRPVDELIMVEPILKINDCPGPAESEIAKRLLALRVTFALLVRSKLPDNYFELLLGERIDA